LRSAGVLPFGLEFLLEFAGVGQGEAVGECSVGGGAIPAGEGAGGGAALGVDGDVSGAGDLDVALDVGEGLAAFVAVFVAAGEQAAGVAQGVGFGVVGECAGGVSFVGNDGTGEAGVFADVNVVATVSGIQASLFGDALVGAVYVVEAGRARGASGHGQPNPSQHYAKFIMLYV